MERVPISLFLSHRRPPSQRHLLLLSNDVHVYILFYPLHRCTLNSRTTNVEPRCPSRPKEDTLGRYFGADDGFVDIAQNGLQRLHLDPKRAVNNVSHHGNTSGATVPIALAEALESGRIQAGDSVLLTSVGAGYTFGAAIHRF